MAGYTLVKMAGYTQKEHKNHRNRRLSFSYDEGHDGLERHIAIAALSVVVVVRVVKNNPLKRSLRDLQCFTDDFIGKDV